MTTSGKPRTSRSRQWSLRLLGEPALVSPNGNEHLLEPRAAALLALAALEPGATRRRVAALLWPDSEPANARQALRQQLLRLRKLGGGELLEGRDALKLAGHVKSDVGDGTSGDGMLLGSFDYGEGDELARWVARERERLHRGTADRLGGLLAQAEAAGDLAGALSVARQLLAADPNSERSHRNLMRLHYLRGDLGQAQAAYEGLRAMLEREFAAVPSAETDQLARTLRAAGAAPPAGAMAVVPPSVLRPPRLVGREREWRALEACWAAPAAAIVTGVGGLGKTRLVTDFAATRGEVAAVAARPGDAFAPYSLLSRLARALVRRVGAQMPPGLGSEMARLLPELGKAEPVRDDADRARLLRAIDALLEIAAAGGLAGVVIDDLHYADAATLEALHGRIPAGGRLRWIVTCRDDELGPEGRALRDSLLSSGMGNGVELAALTEEHVSELLDSLDLPGFAGARLAAAITRHTGGNPLFVLETVKAMLLENTGAGARFPVAANVTALIARRLGRLSAPAVRLARCAAVAGQDFSAELAAHVLGVRPLDLADAWTELERAHVLRDGAFEHDLIHEAAMASVPAAIARRLHAEIAAFLEAAGAEPARVAGHWMTARRPKEAGAAFMRAAARAGDAGRRVEEASLLEQAAGCFERCGDHGARFEALLARAEALLFNDLGEATLAAVHAAENVARNDDERMRALLRKARYLSDSSDAESAVQSGRAGIALARKAKRGDLTLPFSVVVAGGLCDLRRVDEALALLEPFREMEIAAAAPRSRVEYLIQLGITLDLANRLADAVVAFDDAREIAAAHGLKDLLAGTLSNLATTTSKRGDLGRAIEFGRQGLQLWHESELLKGRPMQTQALLAHRLRDIGHYDEAISMLEQALDEFRRAGTRPWIFATAHRLALAYAHVGQHARALKLLAEDPADQPVKVRAVWIAHRAEVARLAGGSALKPIRVALSMLGGDLDDGNNRLVSLFASAIVPPAEGESMATAIAAWAAARERFGMAIAAHVRAADCAMSRGAPDRARPQIEAALRLFVDHEPDNFYRAELWWVASGVFRATGHDAQADRMLVEGAEWIRRIAEQHVRVEYRDTFLDRNPVNRALLAAAGRRG